MSMNSDEEHACVLPDLLEAFAGAEVESGKAPGPVTRAHRGKAPKRSRLPLTPRAGSPGAGL